MDELTGSTKSAKLADWRRRLTQLLTAPGTYRFYEIAAAIALICMMVFSWRLVTNYQQSGKLMPAGLTAALLLANLVPAIALLVLVGRRVALSRSNARIPGVSGRIHVRLVALFSLIAAIPTLLVVLFASLLFQSGIEFWFSDRARGMLQNANDLARGYYQQNLRDVGNESVAMASDLRDYLSQTRIDTPEFAEAYSFQVVSRRLNQSAILQVGSDGMPRVAAIVAPDGTNDQANLTSEMIERLNRGENVLVTATANRIEGMTTLDQSAGIYLYTARTSDLLALSQWERAQDVLTDYNQLTVNVQAMQLRFNLALFVISLALVGLAVFVALRFADHLVRPLGELVAAVRTVSTGNFSPRVPDLNGRDEVGLLSRAFNRMAERLEQQTRQLVGANSELEERRIFIETILESVSAGIVSLDQQGAIRLMNETSKSLLLNETAADWIGESLSSISPEFATLVSDDQMNLIAELAGPHGQMTLAVKKRTDPNGMVITFEDITRQLLDQRRAAWSDVARRIAHEIKNPLTPIQLASERLKRKYARQIETDAEMFVQLTDTIGRQVDDLRRMVDEFSSFARMPKPDLRLEKFDELAEQAVFLQKVGSSHIEFDVAKSGNLSLCCDRRQIAQLLTNILKNAIEAIEIRKESSGMDEAGRIALNLAQHGPILTLSVDDNGVGLSDVDIHRLAEPYFTTRKKGTGLGLAVVKKIVEEHFGEMIFAGNDMGGTRLEISFDRYKLALACGVDIDAAGLPKSEPTDA